MPFSTKLPTSLLLRMFKNCEIKDWQKFIFNVLLYFLRFKHIFWPYRYN